MKLRRPPLLASILALIGIAILCGLGTWQLQRLAWKNDIISKLNTAYASKDAPAIESLAINEDDFIYASAEGIFLADKALLIGPKTHDNKIGHDLIVPLKLKDSTLLVNMGWTDGALETLPIHHVNGKHVRVEGLARKSSWNAFTPANNPATNEWYKPDITEIAAVRNLENPLPVFLYAERASYKFDASFPNNERWHPNNNHLQYAAFWFTMAGILVVIFVLRFVKPR